MADVKKIATRDSYGNALKELGDEFDNVVVLDADLAGATKTGIFKKAYPDRHFNCGIAVNLKVNKTHERRIHVHNIFFGSPNIAIRRHNATPCLVASRTSFIGYALDNPSIHSPYLPFITLQSDTTMYP